MAEHRHFRAHPSPLPHPLPLHHRPHLRSSAVKLLALALATVLAIMMGLTGAGAGDVPGDIDSMPGWLGASYVAPVKKAKVQQGALDYTRVVQLSAWKPRAYLYKGFLTDEECDHLVAKASPRLQRSEVTDDTDGGGEVSEVRTSFGTFVDKGEDEIVKRVEQRISQWTFLPLANQESLQILRYTRGQKYEAHHDYFDDPVNKQQGGHRYATVLMYLNTVPKGGETAFPAVKDPTPKDDTWSDCAKGVLAVKAQKGDAVLFFSMFPDGTPDENSLHYACPVLEGVKWSAPKWIHVGDFDTPLPATSNEPSSCVDSNGMCNDWATDGECTKNPDFMVGTAGYPGACRKACGACKPEEKAAA